MTVSLLHNKRNSGLADPAGQDDFDPKTPGLRHNSGVFADRKKVLAMLADNTRDISEEDYTVILDAFRHETLIHRALIGREELPFSVVARLIRLVAGEADIQKLIQRHGTPHLPLDWRRTTRSRPDWWRKAG